MDKDDNVEVSEPAAADLVDDSVEQVEQTDPVTEQAELVTDSIDVESVDVYD